MRPDPDPPACLPGEEPLVDLDALAEATRAFITADDKPADDQRRKPKPEGDHEATIPRRGSGC